MVKTRVLWVFGAILGIFACLIFSSLNMNAVLAIGNKTFLQSSLGIFGELSAQDEDSFAQSDITGYCPDEGCGESDGSSVRESDGSDVYLIGDYLTVDSTDEIKKLLPNITIDAENDMYFSHDGSVESGVSRIDSMGSQKILVLALGMNGGVNYEYEDDIDKLFDVANGKDFKLILMTVYSNAEDGELMEVSNGNVTGLAGSYDNVTYIDWYTAVGNEADSYFENPDASKLVLTDAGKKSFAEKMAEAINQVTDMVKTSSSDEGGEVVTSGSGYEALKSATRKYGEYAMEMQKEYGTPWEVVLAQMQIESSVGTAGHAVQGATNNWLGITGSGDMGSYTSSKGRKWARFSTVEKSIEAWAGPRVLRNGIYDDAFAYLDPNNWHLKNFLVKMISHYAPGSDGNNESSYVNMIMNLINGPIREVREEKGWLSSEEFAKENNIPIGGKHPLGQKVQASESTSSDGVATPSSEYCAGRSGGGSCNSDEPIGPVFEPSDNIPCDSRTEDAGIETEAYHNGERLTIRLCSVPNIIQNGSKTGHALVNSRVSGAFFAFAERFKEQTGKTLEVSQSFRSMADQQYFYNCMITKACNHGNLAGKPGYSKHQAGLAIDLRRTNGAIEYKAKNMADFGFRDGMTFSQPEDWHVEPQLKYTTYETKCESDTISEGGLTYEQAKRFMVNYGANKNNSSSNFVPAGTWRYPTCNGGGGSNCTAFSAFFLNKFTSVPSMGGNGSAVVTNLNGVEKGTTPKVWSVFSVTPNHTGVILGYHDGKWIVGHASCRSTGSGAGTGEKGTGAGFVVMSENINVALLQSGSPKYAYLEDKTDFSAIERYLSTGE